MRDELDPDTLRRHTHREQGMKYFQRIVAVGLLTAGFATCGRAAEVCTTQSQMKPGERDTLAAAATTLAKAIQADDQSTLKAKTIPEYQKDFSGVASVVNATAPMVRNAQLQVEQVYLLDASTLAKSANGANPDASFFCTLNQSQATAEFSIPQLPPGRYAFAMVRMEEAAPWRLSFLMRQEGGQWALAGLYPKALTAAGHDGVWYWKQARAFAAEKEQWNSWLYMQQAQALLLPANFVSSTHLDKLQSELTADAPPAVASGLSTEAPLVVKGLDGAEYRFTAVTVDDSLGKEKVDLSAHLKVDALGDPAVARKRNTDAMEALVAAHPEFKQAFHGVWIFAEAPGVSPYATELAMSEIH